MPFNEWINMLSFQCLMRKDYFQISASPLAFSCFDFNQCAEKKQRKIENTLNVSGDRAGISVKLLLIRE